MSNFSDQVPISNQLLQFLPLFHTCDAFKARTYLKNRLLHEEEICEVFDEPITYLFYGRPAFKYKTKEGATSNPALYPICFVFDVDLLAEIKRIYPFDTGALFHKILHKFIHDGNVVADFEMEPNKQRINDIVLHFHGDNDNYLNSKLGDREIDPFDFESISFANMHNSYVPDAADERRVTIEVQAPQDISLAGDALKAIIIPSSMLDSYVIRDFLDGRNVDVRTYDIDVWDPKSSFAIVANVAKNYIKAKAK